MDVAAATEFLARSSTLTSVGWIGYIIIGGLAGIIFTFLTALGALILLWVVGMVRHRT